MSGEVGGHDGHIADIPGQYPPPDARFSNRYPHKDGAFAAAQRRLIVDRVTSGALYHGQLADRLPTNPGRLPSRTIALLNGAIPGQILKNRKQGDCICPVVGCRSHKKGFSGCEGEAMPHPHTHIFLSQWGQTNKTRLLWNRKLYPAGEQGSMV
jgi:hypothetical protein